MTVQRSVLQADQGNGLPGTRHAVDQPIPCQQQPQQQPSSQQHAKKKIDNPLSNMLRRRLTSLPHRL